MQQVNDYMDDLFKKAADHYPLSTKSSNWGNFNRKLNEQSGFYSGKSSDQKFWGQVKRWTAVAVFVFIPLAIAVLKPYTFTQVQQSNVQASVNSPATNAQNAIEISGKSTATYIHKEYAPNVFNKNLTSNGLAGNVKEFGKVITPPELLADVNKTDSLNLTAKQQDDILVNSVANEPILNNNNKAEEIKKQPDLSANRQQPNSVSSKKSRFYLGAVLAPEYTRVKLQQFSKPGINFGVITGFQVKKNLSVELGVLLAKKYYYSDGKYLPKNSLSRDGSDIISLEAYNSITELPFVVKYNFKEQKKGDFFASAGAVSYVMHKELYNYSYDANGQEKEGVKYVNKAANYYFSNIQLSVGYERQVSKNGMLRVEPYYRIPISGIGISDLPVTSIGLNIALTTRLK